MPLSSEHRGFRFVFLDSSPFPFLHTHTSGDFRFSLHFFLGGGIVSTVFVCVYMCVYVCVCVLCGSRRHTHLHTNANTNTYAHLACPPSPTQLWALNKDIRRPEGHGLPGTIQVCPPPTHTHTHPIRSRCAAATPLTCTPLCALYVALYVRLICMYRRGISST